MGKQLSPPVADFTSDVTTGTNLLTVNFTDTSLNNPTSWLWDFGDGNTSTLQNPQHTYTIGGTYNVSLTATNSFGSNLITKNSYITSNILAGQQIFTSSFSIQDWTVPTGVTSFSVVGISGGGSGTYGTNGAGGGGGGFTTSSVGGYGGAGGAGAVRIIWGTGRSFPSNAS